MVRSIRESTRVDAEKILRQQTGVCLGVTAAKCIPDLRFEFDARVKIHVRQTPRAALPNLVN
jgi:hypothetical protein